MERLPRNPRKRSPDTLRAAARGLRAMEWLRDTEEAVKKALQSINSQRTSCDPPLPLCVDLEFDSHSPELTLSLMQVSVGDKIHIFDAVAVPGFDKVRGGGNTPSLTELLQDTSVVVVMHDARQDRRCLANRNIIPMSIYDSQIAHRDLTGKAQESLKNVLMHWLNVEIDKGGQRMEQFIRQKGKWLERPLPDWVLDYAANDVKHLPALYEALEMAKQGKLEGSALSSSAAKAKVKWFDRKKGIGFAAPAGGGDDVFLHRRNFASALKVEVDDVIDYEIGEYNGRAVALNVRVLSPSMPSAPPPPGQAPPPGRAPPPGQAPPGAPAATPERSSGAASGPAMPTNPIDTAIAFGCALKAEPPLRAKIVDKEAFVREYNEWKAREYFQGRQRTGNPSSCLYYLKNCSQETHALHGLPTVRAKGNVVRIIVDANASAYARKAAAAQGVHDKRDEVEADKGGVEVAPVTFDEVISVGGVAERRVTVRNVGSKHRVVTAKLLIHKPGKLHVAFELGDNAGAKVTLPPGGIWTVLLRARPPWAGIHRDILMLNFGGFRIGRYLEVRSGDAALLELLKPKAPYVPNKRKRLLPMGRRSNIIGAPKMSSSTAAPQQGPKLKVFGLLESGWQSKLQRARAEAENLLWLNAERMHTLRAGESDAAAQKTYADQQSRLLFTEEVQLLIDLRGFDFEGEHARTLERRGGLLWLKVPGLAEKRPSVLRGDKVHMRPAGSDPEVSKHFEGVAERIEAEEVGLRFSPSFQDKYVLGQRLDVHFVLGRTPLRLFHQGIEGTKELRMSILFPERSDLLGEPAEPRPLVPFRDTAAFDSSLNEEQRSAVVEILSGKARQVPYVLFGPPGTGKTTTVAEVVLQAAVHLRKRMPTGSSFHILVCAPTNTAADHLCEKLARRLGSKLELLRLMAYSRSLSDVPEILRKLTNWDENTGSFETPDLETLLKPAVVVATLTKAASIVNLGVPRGHFDMIVIDEGGQAFEAEALAPVGCLLGTDGQLVVAGDPKQLGPVVHHSLAKEHGLHMSFLERLMERTIYLKDSDARSPTVGKHDGRVITKLVRNYRSHPTLLELPNALFYDNDLVSCVDERGHVLQNWEGLERPGVPLLWHGVAGKDTREKSSPSWFNNDEVVQVVSHVKDLLAMRMNRPRQDEIGVITPYNQQVHRINLALRSQGLSSVKVGSTEMFQGQEKKVIIISTVRSSEQWLDFDTRHNLGFLDNPKRFNVAITRAMALLIIVGNPTTLASDFHWRELLKLSVSKGAYRGPPLPDGLLDDEAEVEVDDNLVNDLELLLENNPDEDGDEDEETAPSQQMMQEAMEMPSHDY